MLSQSSRVSRLAGLFLAVVVLVTLPPLAAAQAQTLTNDAVLQMIRWKMNDSEIVAVIERNDTQFDLTPSTVALLKDSGVDDTVLEAMWKATLKSSKGAQPAPAPATATPTPPPASPSAQTIPPQSAKPIPAHTPDRFAQAKAVKPETETVPPYNPPCPPSNDGKQALRHIRADWDSGSISPSRVDSSGPACFEVHNFNDILYLPVFSLTEIPLQGSDIDLLKGAMAALTGLFTGTGQNNTDQAKIAEKKKQPLFIKAIPPSCPATLSSHLEAARGAAGVFHDALAELDPGKDSNGKFNYVPLATTLAKWQPVPGEYEAFQSAVQQVIKDLNLPGADNCTDGILASAEAVVIDAYLPAQSAYPVLASHVTSQHIVRFTGDLEATSDYDFVVKPTYGGADTTAGSKTFHLSAGRKILTASAGFLITELPARSYTSRTVPAGTSNSATQNVLGVDFGNGPRPALTALLNYHLFFADWHRFGFALSAGPVFDISSGKADTSRLGFFGGASLHLWNRLYVTPGVHVGEFADFPQGFAAGSIIPPNTGTPQPTKRYTARFAIGITFRVKDLGETPTKSSSETVTPGSSTGAGGSGSGGPSGQSDKQKPKK
jgi:hypothetical protein